VTTLQNCCTSSMFNKAIVDIGLCPLPTVCNPHFAGHTGLDRPTLAIKRLPLSCACHCVDQCNSQFRGVLGLLGTIPPKLPLSLQGSSPQRNTLFLRPGPLIIPNGISISSAVFVWVLNAML